jgi:hypothetical protein
VSVADHRDVFTGGVADETHHVSARGPDGIYLDPPLVIFLVRYQHVIEHVVQRAAGVGEGADLPPDFLRLTRSGLFLVRLGEHHGDGIVTLPATFVRETGLMLHRVAANIGRRLDDPRRATL